MHAVSLVHVALLALATSSWAITITKPGLGDTWSSTGPNIVSWTEVSTDPTTFDLKLVQNGVDQLTLASNVDGTKGTFTVMNVNLPTGTGFQVNAFSTSPNNAGILAQSQRFNITQGGSSSSASSTGALSTGTGTGLVTVSPSIVIATGTGTATITSGASDTNIPNTSSSPAATKSNAASLSAPTHGGLMGLLALFGLALV